MTLVVGIDPGWKRGSDSGVAVVAGTGTSWKVLAIAPSFAAFTGEETTLDAFEIELVLRHAERLAGERVSVAAIDMPLSTEPVTARRPADDAISKAFGGRGCSTHSPSATRPGPLADECRRGAESYGLPLVTATSRAATLPATIEVYPHPALLTLLGIERRFPYKVGRARSYWSDRPAADVRRARLLDAWRTIVGALRHELGEIPLALPADARARDMKPLEDQVDALVSAWVGIRYTLGRAHAYGDARAAIWCPT